MFNQAREGLFKLNNKNIAIILLISSLSVIYDFAVILNIASFFGVERLYNNSGTNDLEDFVFFLAATVFIAVITPLYEEFVFRYFLTKKNPTFYLSVITPLFIAISTISALLIPTSSISIILFLVWIVLFIGFRFLSRKFSEIKINNITYSFAIIFSTLVFCWLHASRYKIFDNPLQLIKTLSYITIQYLPISLFFTFIRLKFQEGFKASLFAHMISNLVVMILLFISLYIIGV